MIRYRSTRAPQDHGVGFAEAMFRGQAPDGGLYMPDAVPRLPAERPVGGSFADVARRALGVWLDDELGAEVTAELCCDAFDFPVPVVPLDDGTWVLELFHGPTAAFKDFGARFLARALARVRPRGQRLTVLVATSGDTGSAVAQAFDGLADAHVVVLYPADKVSPLQEAQLTSGPANAHAVRVAGDFDDCQRLVKKAFADADLNRALGLTSANSINVGRLVPQLTYYVHGADLLALEDGARDHPMHVVVPSGNLGNLMAGLFAREGGAPIERFVAAANRNDVFPEFLATGVLRARASVTTPSNAMDVGNPSNAARIQALYASREDALRRDIVGESVDDETTYDTIRDVYAKSGRLLCPHTAVGVAARRRHRDVRRALVLATAHPGKFAEIVREATDADVPLPESLQRALETRRDPTDLPADIDALRRFLHTL